MLNYQTEKLPNPPRSRLLKLYFSFMLYFYQLEMLIYFYGDTYTLSNLKY